MGLAQVKAKLTNVSGCTVLENVLIGQYTSFNIGGPVDLLVEPESIEALQKVLQILAEGELPLFVLGKGSNLLVSDRGIKGVVLRLTGLNQIEINETKVRAGSGISLAKLARSAQKAELTGLEFASGIPGTLGGAAVMNAGAYGREIKDVLTEITAFTYQGEKKIVAAQDAGFGYRQSIFQQNNWIIAQVEMELATGDPLQISALMKDLNKRRQDKQPVEFFSAGSTFKRPEGYYAGALIEEAGLKGYAIGDAQVSEKHAGFIINRGQATADDVFCLIRYVQKRVQEKSGVILDPEVRFVGEFDYGSDD